MKNGRKTKSELIEELDSFRRKVKKLETLLKKCKHIEQNITERKRAEEALRESIQILHLVLDTIPVRVFWKDIDLNYLGCNQSFALDSGLASPEEIVGKSDWEMGWRNQAEAYRSDDRLVIGTGKPKLNYEEPQTTPDGQRIWLSTNKVPLLDAEGNIKGILGTYEDITERKRAEEALRETRDYLENLLGFANAPIMVWDNNNRITRFNLAFERLTGYTMYDVLGKHPEIIFPAEMREDLSALISRTSDGENLISVELSVHCKDGSVRIVLWNTSNVYTADGKTIIATIAHGQNITERKQAEGELKKNEEKYRSIFENVQDVYYETSFDGTVLEVSPSIEVVSKGQYHRDDLIGKSMYNFYYIADRRQILLSLLQERGSVSDYEFMLKNRDGSHIPCSISAKIQFDAHGTPLKIVGSLRDITERKHAEDSLQESELRFRDLYENAKIGLYRTTPDGTILIANMAMVKMLRYPSFEKLAKRNLEKDGYEPTYQRKEFLEKIERDGEVNGYESKWICQDGTAIFVLESARAVRDSKGKTLYYDGTVENITERKLLEDQMRQMQKLEGLGTLAGGIAHDFNNILGIILAYITSIKRFKDDAKNLGIAVDTIVKAVDRGKTLVKQILTFARKSDTEFGPVDVNDLVMEIMTMILETFPRTLTYSQNFDKAVPYINADRSQLHQALLNLCVNARDAMPKGGVLTINTQMVSVASLRNQHPDVAASSYVCIEVIDTGEGMSEEIRKRIFEPFFTTKGIGKGTGLGLSVVFGVIQSHKGFIDVDSELGKGTTFRFYLPASQVAEPIKETKEKTLEEMSGGTETLLVVEDEEALMMSLQMVLVDKGYKVLSARDGFTALKIYQEKKNEIALVLTDLGLPNISGLEVCNKIKKINPNQHVILASGYIDPNMKSELLKTRIQHFLYKPYDLIKVLKEVRKVLGEK